MSSGLRIANFGRSAARAALEVLGLEVDDAVRGAFAAGGGDRQHHAHWQRGGDHGTHLHLLAHVEPAPLAAVGRADRDGLRGVDHAAAADGEQEVDAFGDREAHAFLDERAARVGLHAAEFDEGDAGLGEGRLHAGEESAPNGAAAAVVHERLASAEPPHELARARFLAFPEGDVGWRPVVEIDHDVYSLPVNNAAQYTTSHVRIQCAACVPIAAHTVVKRAREGQGNRAERGRRHETPCVGSRSLVIQRPKRQLGVVVATSRGS